MIDLVVQYGGEYCGAQREQYRNPPPQSSGPALQFLHDWMTQMSAEWLHGRTIRGSTGWDGRGGGILDPGRWSEGRDAWSTVLDGWRWAPPRSL
ncbi:hypothetical protein GCM10010174_25390 [Kutzneria viridogrisea]